MNSRRATNPTPSTATRRDFLRTAGAAGAGLALGAERVGASIGAAPAAARSRGGISVISEAAEPGSATRTSLPAASSRAMKSRNEV